MASATDSDEEELLAALERDLDAVSLSDHESEGEEQELPDVVPLKSLEELLAADAQQLEYQGGAEEPLVRLRALLQDGERRRQCFMEDVEALQGLTSSVEPQDIVPVAEAHAAGYAAGPASGQHLRVNCL